LSGNEEADREWVPGSRQEKTMTRKKRPNQKMQTWIDVRKRHRLSHAQVQMARELGMNPK
jgi:hypothetical protein